MWAWIMLAALTWFETSDTTYGYKFDQQKESDHMYAPAIGAYQLVIIFILMAWC